MEQVKISIESILKTNVQKNHQSYFQNPPMAWYAPFTLLGTRFGAMLCFSI